MSLVSLPSYPTTSFHTTPEYLDFLKQDPPETQLRSSSSSSPITLRMSDPLQTHNNNSPRHLRAEEDDGYPEEDGLEWVNSRIRGLEAFASPEARHKVLPWLDEVPRGGRPDDERSFAGGSTRTGGILKRESISRKPLPSTLQHNPPPIVPLPTTPLRNNNTIDSPVVLPSLPYERRDESVSAADLQHQLDGTATDVSRVEREREEEERSKGGRRAASGDVPSPFIPLRKEVSKHHRHSRTGQDQPSTNSNDPDRNACSPQSQHQERLHNNSRASHRPAAESPSTDPRTSTSSFGNVDNPDKGDRRLTLPVKRAPSAAGTEMGSTVRRRWEETANQPPPDLPSRPSPVPSTPAGILPERDNDSTRTVLPSPPRQHHSTAPTPTPIPSNKNQIHQHSQSQQLVRSNRAPSLSTHRHSADATRSTTARASLFHDKVLCELLEASSNPSLGEEVKKVLKTAVEKRVGELAREVLRQEVDGRGLDLRQQHLHEAPPPWAIDLLTKLEANNSRIETILRSLPLPTSSSSTPTNVNDSYPPPNAYIVPLSPISPTQDIPATSSSPTRSQSRPTQHPLGTSLGLFTESPPTFDNPSSSTQHTFGKTASEARALYVEVDPATFHPVGPPGIIIAPPSSIPPVSSQRAQTGTVNSSTTSPPPVPVAPQILVQAPSTNRSRTPALVTSPVVEQPVLPEAQEIITRDFADRDLPQIPPEIVETDSEAGVFAFKPPPVPEDEVERQPTMDERGVGGRAGREKEEFGEDPILPRLMEPRPWDLVTQRLYAWAVIWSMDDFTRALEEISLARQVNSFALTIWTTTTYKRQLRHRICSNPTEVVDKMFVPPNLGDSLNQACYHKRFNDAKMLIEELWTPFGLSSLCPTGFPRVILAICRHRNEDDTWAVHRFDLASSTMRTFLFYSGDRKRLADGRPFSWWHAIRAAWPNAGIKDPDNSDMVQKTDHVQIPLAEGGDVSLEAVNCFRNLLMGWRWDRPTEIYKLRELIWMETKRLMTRKAEGRLIMDLSGDTGRMSDI
ncbi:hypothetical protein BDY24DRAFT_394041 [Mrakia frigida]|uniref:uncharacterized protein n=1 Tax=Mrakia frigida TaxID=29902 RepID=UPI003FCC142C